MIARLLLRVWSRRVPPVRRDRWLEEWHGELTELERRAAARGRPGRLPALRFVWGARAHAAALAKEARHGEPDRTTTTMTRMTTMGHDLRFALRSFRRAPGFTAVAVLTLALGIGATTAMFSVLDGVVLRPLPYDRPDELVMVGSTSTRFPGLAPVAPGDFLDWRDQAGTFSHMVAVEGWTLDLIDADRPARVPTAAVTGGFFDMLGVAPELGRGITAEDALEGAEPVVVLSHGLWTRRYGADPAIVGRRIGTADRTFTVVGVMPASFRHPEAFWSGDVDLWMPTSQTGSNMTTRGGRFLQVMGRLRPDASLFEARQEMTAISAALTEAYPATNTGRAALVEPLRSETIGDVGRALALLMGATGMLLLIACVNVANLFMARATGRESEIAVRTAMGAGAGRVRSQLLTEGLTLSLVGGAAGIGLAYFGVAAFRSINPAGIPRVGDVTVDTRVVVFSFLVSVATGVAFALVPALRMARPGALAALRDGARAGAGAAGRRLRSTLVAAELALAVVLMVGAGLLINSFVRLQSVDPGFDRQGAVTMAITLNSGYEGRAEQTTFFRTLVEGTEAIPGVRAAGYTSALPLAGDRYLTGIRLEDREVDPSNPDVAEYSNTSPGYFATMGIGVVAGREFGPLDDEGAERVALVNEAFVRQYWPGDDPLGRKIGRGRREVTWYTVVGVVEDVHRGGLDEPAQPEMYFSAPQNGITNAQVVVRTDGEADEVVAGMRRLVEALDGTLPVEFSTLEAYVADSVRQSRFYSQVFGAFALVALLLAGVGVYGTMSYTVTQRTREMGIRLALGAEAGQVAGLVAGEGLRVTAIGLVTGLAGAALGARLLESLLFDVGARDPLTYLAGALFLALVAMVACWLPARRAGGADPMGALRAE